MANPEVNVDLTTQPASGIFQLLHFVYPGMAWRRSLDLNLVQAMSIPGGETVENPFHSFEMDVLTASGDPIHESVTMNEEKAHRLAEFFANLRPGHDKECHDMVVEVEGWDPDKEEEPGSIHEILLPSDPRPSGEPYSVQIACGEPEDAEELDWGASHSCHATDEGRMLGLVGRGSMLVTMRAEDMVDFYSRGAPLATLSRTVVLS